MNYMCLNPVKGMHSMVLETAWNTSEIWSETLLATDFR